MSDDDRASAWKESEKLLNKGKTEGALEVLRKADPNGEHPTTLRLAATAIHIQASKKGSKSLYRKAASLARDAVKMNPRDKQSNSLYNEIKNDMQDRSISETIIPRLMNESGPTPAGLLAVVVSIMIIIAGITVAQSGGESNEDVLMKVRWTDRNGEEHNGTIWITLYDDETPMHAESFRSNVDMGRYDGIPFHRIVDEFMIQGGDFVNKAGTGGYAGAYFGYCSPTFEQTDDCADDETKWVVPAEFGQTHEPGVVAAARSQHDNSHGSQFYLVDSTGAYSLDGRYTAFGIAYDGEIDGVSTTGVEVIDQISQVECQGHNGPCSDSSGSSSTYPVLVVEATLIEEGGSTPWYQFW
ncbi:MAG: peptidylprolyl isomerase [Candidatus Poseidoniaceae archaeon]|nr:peptidylprolyl isomerase [Candidatus Poseidoniaceae archaeon]